MHVYLQLFSQKTTQYKHKTAGYFMQMNKAVCTCRGGCFISTLCHLCSTFGDVRNRKRLVTLSSLCVDTTS